ncbi:MAG: GTP 3',8-cyclase MoaA [Candidatus Altiarchaeota archaeon]
MMIDGYGRKIEELRISVTQECNLDCAYCHREGEVNPGRQMATEEIIILARHFAEAGVRRVKITGGEPLLREDIVGIVNGISELEGIDEVSMTTNGLLLAGKARAVREAGLKRVNIGCDSMSSPLLLKNASTIREGLKAAKLAGLEPIKLNMVVLRGINEHEIPEMMEFARSQGVILQLIELINTDADFYTRHYYPLEGVEESLKSRATLIVERRSKSRMQYYLDDLIVEVVRPNCREFCVDCNKIRLTSDGRIKPCLRIFGGHIPVGGDFTRSLEKALDSRVIGCDGR